MAKITHPSLDIKSEKNAIIVSVTASSFAAQPGILARDGPSKRKLFQLGYAIE
jgi:hypothetical protein